MSGESRPLTSRQPHSLSLGPGGHLSWAKLGQVSPELPGPAEAEAGCRTRLSLGLVSHPVWHRLAIISSFVHQRGLLPVVVKKEAEHSD